MSTRNWLKRTNVGLQRLEYLQSNKYYIQSFFQINYYFLGKTLYLPQI